MVDVQSSENDREVFMVNDHLASAPGFGIPEGFQLRWYRPGDEADWTRIQRAADRYNDITDDLFARQFPAGIWNLSDRQCYLTSADGTPVATATAWEESGGSYDGNGLVHWVAVLPESQHRGLGKAIMSILCRRMMEIGYERACLRTSVLRTDALALYHRFGFTEVS